MSSSNQLRLTVYSSLMAALIAAGSFMVIPLGPVPITMQSLFVLLAGLLLGRKWAAGCLAVFLLAGAAGLPVFHAGKGGLAHFAGPTGGYLLGYLAAAYVVATVADKVGSAYANEPSKRFAFDLVAVVLGSLTIYAMGVPWLKTVTQMPWQKAIAVGVLPFLVGDAIKLAAAAIIARMVRPLMKLSD